MTATEPATGIRIDASVAAYVDAYVHGWAVSRNAPWIRTSPEYRRRGLGRTVMRRLLGLAHRHGARRAVLDASAEGRELYLGLGWAIVAGQVGVNRPPLSR